MTKCIFACDGVKCSTSNAQSFQYIICKDHLKEVFGLKVVLWTSENPRTTDLVGPYLTPDDHYCYRAGDVIVPCKSFLDGFLVAAKADAVDVTMYRLNERISIYYNNMLMNRMKFVDNKPSRYHFELIRNLFSEDGKVSMVNDHDTAMIDLKKHVQNRLSDLNHWVESETYYSLFQNLKVKKLKDGAEVAIDELTDRFVGFILFNCLYDVMYIYPNVDNGPITLYANTAYVEKVGLVALTAIHNNVPLVALGTGKLTNAYFQHKVHSEPKQVVANRISVVNFPDAMRSPNVTSTSDRFCAMR